MSFLDSLFGGGNKNNPANAAMPYLNRIPGAVNPYYQPYINQGQEAGQLLGGQYNQMINNPNELYNRLGAGYQESPGSQFKLRQGLQAGTNAAAAGGMAGSPQHVQGNTQIANDIANQDYEQYLNHILGLYGQGITGEQGLQTQGYGASTGYGNILGSNLAQQGGLAFQGQAGQNQQNANMLSNLLSLGSTFLPALGIGKSLPNFLSNRSYG